MLRQRLKGPALAAYYPRKMATFKDLQKVYGPEFETYDEVEEDRLEKIKMYVKRGDTAYGAFANFYLVSKQEGRVLQKRRGQKQVCVAV